MVSLMSIPCDATAVFKCRVNKFLGVVDILTPTPMHDVEVHIHDPGRLTELLYPGNKVLLKSVHRNTRKTGWDVIAARCNRYWVLVHSGYHRGIAKRIIEDERLSPFGRVTDIKPEVQYGDSKFDFLVEKATGTKVWVEVKGCTLAVDGIAMFPDAPTQRGRRHLKLLSYMSENNLYTAVLILIFRPDARCFAPNHHTDPKFADIFWYALDVGVKVYPIVLEYVDAKIYYKGGLPICGRNKLHA